MNTNMFLIPMHPEGAWGHRRQWRLCWEGRKAPFFNTSLLLIPMHPEGV